MNTGIEQEGIALIMDLIDSVQLDIEDILISLEELSNSGSDKKFDDVIRKIKAGRKKMSEAYWLLGDQETLLKIKEFREGK